MIFESFESLGKQINHKLQSSKFLSLGSLFHENNSCDPLTATCPLSGMEIAHASGFLILQPFMQGYLDKLHKEISRTLEKIASREKYINNQLEHHLQEFRGVQDSLAEVRALDYLLKVLATNQVVIFMTRIHLPLKCVKMRESFKSSAVHSLYSFSPMEHVNYCR